MSKYLRVGGLVGALLAVAASLVLSVALGAASETRTVTGVVSTPLTASHPICAATHLTLGRRTWGYGYGAEGTTVEFTYQDVTNTGTACRFLEPHKIQVQSGTHRDVMTAVLNGSTSAVTLVGAHQKFVLVLGDWWRVQSVPGTPGNSCTKLIDSVRTVKVPSGHSWITVSLGTTWRTVCHAPTSLSISLSTTT